MVDATQIVIIAVILVLMSMLAVIGVQVYFILREFRTTLQKTNKVLDDTGIISEAVSKPVEMLSSLALGIKRGTAVMKALIETKETVAQKTRRFIKSGRKL